jgi:hypothetical protein
MGSFFAAQLALAAKKTTKQSAAPTSVWMVSSWTEHVEKINAAGLVLETVEATHDGETVVKRKVESPYIRATADPLEVVADGNPPGRRSNCARICVFLCKC